MPHRSICLRCLASIGQITPAEVWGSALEKFAFRHPVITSYQKKQSPKVKFSRKRLLFTLARLSSGLFIEVDGKSVKSSNIVVLHPDFGCGGDRKLTKFYEKIGVARDR